MDNFVKQNDGAVINKDIAALERYKSARRSAENQKKLESQVVTLEKEFASVKNDVTAIKDLLLELNSRIS
jgi:septal ring factor EnvC (AmiA/AmiB activator)